MPFQMQPLQLLPAWGHSRSALLRVHCWHELAGDYTWDPKSLSRHTTTRIISAPYDYLNKSRNKKSSVCGGNFLKNGNKNKYAMWGGQPLLGITRYPLLPNLASPTYSRKASFRQSSHRTANSLFFNSFKKKTKKTICYVQHSLLMAFHKPTP